LPNSGGRFAAEEERERRAKEGGGKGKKGYWEEKEGGKGMEEGREGKGKEQGKRGEGKFVSLALGDRRPWHFLCMLHTSYDYIDAPCLSSPHRRLPLHELAFPMIMPH